MRSISAVLLAVLLAGCQAKPSSTPTAAATRPRATAGVTAGMPAIDFDGETADGVPVVSQQYRGKVILLDFWATWCPPCLAEIPKEKALVEKMKDSPFVLVGISADESRETLRQFLADRPLPWVNVSDPSNRLASKWKIRAFPTFVLIGTDGKVLERWEGGGQSADIDRAVERAVAGVAKE